VTEAYVPCSPGLRGCRPLSIAELHTLASIRDGHPDGDARIRIHLSGGWYAAYGRGGLHLTDLGREVLQVAEERSRQLAGSEEFRQNVVGGRDGPLAEPLCAMGAPGDTVDMDGLTSDTREAWDALVAAAA